MKNLKISLIKKADEYLIRYTYLVKIVASILTIFACIRFTTYLMQDVIKVGDRSASLIAGIIFGVILSGAIANMWEAVVNFKDLKTVALERYPLKPKDGQVCKISGILKPLGPGLISPFTRTPCVAYKYKITHYFEDSDSPTQALDANGGAMTPSVIQGEKYKIKICGHADFEGFAYLSIDIESDPENLENANRYIRETIFDRPQATSVIGEIKTFYMDKSGEYRFDVKDNFENLKGKDLSEMCVPVEAEVVGIGEYSSTLNGLTKGKKGRLRIIAGNIDEVQNGLHTKVWARLILGIVLLLIYVFVLAVMYLLHFRPSF